MVTLDMKTAMTEVASSGGEAPAAMRVAPATSGVRQRASDTRVSEGTKKSSQTTVRPGKQNKMIFYVLRQWPKHGEEALANTLQILRGLGNTPLSRGEAEGQGGIA